MTTPDTGEAQGHDSGDAIVVSGMTKVYAPLRLRLRSLRPISRDAPVTALREVDLTVRTGEVLGLLGTNGAGKTTLIKILATLVLPSSGTVTVGGFDVARGPDPAKALVGFVNSEERSFYWRLTGRQNLEFFGAFQGLDGRATRGRIAELADTFGLDALDRSYAEHSTGMRHRLAIARALLRQPRILLLDEPTRSLDPVAATSLRRVVRETLVGTFGCTVVLATHNLQEAEELGGRLAMLHHGRLAGTGTMAALRRQAGLAGAAAPEEVFARLAAQAEAREGRELVRSGAREGTL